MSQKINFKINGIHCKSCKTLIEEEVKNIKNVKKINVDHVLGEASLEIEGEENVQGVYGAIEDLGYNVSENLRMKNEESDRENKKQDNESSRDSSASLRYAQNDEEGGERDFSRDSSASTPVGGSTQNDRVLGWDDKVKRVVFGGVLLVLFVLGYFLVQNLGGFEILSRLNEREVSYALIFLIGILSSFHCVGMCGGLVVTYSVNSKQLSDNRKRIFFNEHVQYNLGRLVSYTVIGGVLGGFGSFFGLNPSFSGGVLLVAGFFMILMGLSIVTKFKWLEVVKLKTPEFIAKFLYKNKKSDKPKGPLVIGLLTGFMPCGPLQAMQLFALTTGSIYYGAISMFLYSLGTIPLMFGFGSVVTMMSNVKLKQIMKVSGVIVVILGMFMINRGLINFGMGVTSLLPTGAQSKTEYVVTGEIEEYQIVEMDVTYSGYKPNVIYLKKDIPVRWVIKDKGITGCTNEIFLYHENGVIKKKLNNKETVIEFTPSKLGEMKFSCWMRMVWGKFIVTEDGDKSAGGLYKEEVEVPEGVGSCTGCANESTCGGDGEVGSCGGSCGGEVDTGCGCAKTRVGTQ